MNVWWAQKEVNLQYAVDRVTYAQTNADSMDFAMTNASPRLCIVKRAWFSKSLLKIPCNVIFFK